jgi:selenocysteine-specific elongation factor
VLHGRDAHATSLHAWHVPTGESTVPRAMPDVVPYILATAGHVDHGKSALVRALTGVDPDRLPEEKARGITIDLGFAALDLAGPDGQTVRLGVVDVPGHEDFVKNMVAGIGSVDLALLVVAADDGWMPQTEEHLQILAYQGVTRGLVAVTKVDLATEEDATIEAVRDRLQGSPLAGAAIVATSVVTGRGLDDLRAALAAAAVAGPPPSDVGKPRLPVDRAFALRGVGTVVTGTLTGGTLSRGQAVVARPGSAGGKIRSLQSHNRDAPVARPGSRVAVNVPELAGVGRGAVVTLATLGEATDTLDVWLARSSRAEGPPLAHAARVFVHHGTAAVAGRVYLLDRASPMVPGQAGLAQLRLESPVYAWAGDRMVLRDAQQRHTLAGGRVLDPAAARRGYNRERRRATLALRAGSPDDATVMAAAELADHAVLGRASVLVRSQFSATEVAAALDGLVRDGRAVAVGPRVVDAERWAAWLAALAGAVDAEHRARPEHIGVAVADLRAVAAAVVVDPAVIEPLLAALVDGRAFVRRGAAVARAGHRPALPAHLAAAGARVRTALAAKPLEPPNRRELTPTATDRAALQFLLDTGEAVAVGEELVLLADAIDRAAAAVRAHVAARGPASASDLRQALGTTRRIMMPLLELLDRRSVTRRIGDLRDVRPA